MGSSSVDRGRPVLEGLSARRYRTGLAPPDRSGADVLTTSLVGYSPSLPPVY